MKIGYGARVGGLVFILLLVVILGGCGFKTEPVPPESVVPRAIEDLRYAIDESGVRLTWSYPVKTIKGTEIVNVSSYDVYRAVVPLDEICESCPIPFGDPIEIPGGVTSVEGKRRDAEYRTALLRSGHKYFFKVRSRTSWWANSGDSNIVSFVWHIPTNAPTDVVATADDSRITLNWKAVATLVDGRAVAEDVSYQVLRSEGGKDFQLLGEPVKQTQFVDSRVINGQKYFYKVQSQRSFKGHVVNGGMSDVITAAPIDKTPPLPPAGVTAVETSSGIKVFWDRSDDTDVAGYRIYRRLADKKVPTLLGEVSSTYTLFVDANVPEDIRVYYSVTAFDRSKPANESDQSREVTIR